MAAISIALLAPAAHASPNPVDLQSGQSDNASDSALHGFNGLSQLYAGAVGSAQPSAVSMTAAPSDSDGSEPATKGTATGNGIAEILVSGTRSLNNDIQRTRDDIQPYVVFDSTQLIQSGAQNIEDFLQARLPMNATQQTQSQVGLGSPAGRLNLRGLGTDETLVLVDGRRLPSVSTGDSFAQPNINGISMSQIERIEVLPATASGIYGGGATGGVINIILKRDYSGLDLEARYNDSTDFKSGQSYLFVNGGLTLDDGRLRIMGSASRSRSKALYANDRGFFRKGAQLQFRNDPTNSTILIGGPNLCSTVDGFDCVADKLMLKNGTALNSNLTNVPLNYSGNPADLSAQAGKLITNRSNVPIWTAPEVTTYSFNVRREFGKNIEAFVDFSRDKSRLVNDSPLQYNLYIPESAAANPFQQDVLASFSVPKALRQSQISENTRLNVGTIIRLPFKWSASLEYGWLRNKNRSESNSVLGPASDDAEAALQSAIFSNLQARPLTDPLSLFDVFTSLGTGGTKMDTASLRVGGPVFKLPGGDFTATGLVERRIERSDQTINTSIIGGFPTYRWSPQARQKVDSAYLELNAPIFSPANKIPFVHELQLTGSIRRDKYNTRYAGYSIDIDSQTGPFPDLEFSKSRLASTNYTVGIKYAPSMDIAFRASWGDGFLPPKLSNLLPEPPAPFSDFLIFLLNLRDPARSNALIPGPLTIIGGGNPNLQPERSRSLSAGVILTPRFVPGLRISVDLTSIRKSGEVLNLPVSFFLANENVIPGRIVRGPNLPGDTPGEPGPITSVDTSAVNLARSKLRAIDIQADYSIEDARAGTFKLYGAATYTDELSLTAVPGEPAVNRAGYFDGPLKWRANVGVDWTSGSWGAGVNTQIYGSYRICQSVLTEFTCAQEESWQGALKVKAQTYTDFYVNYTIKASGALDGTSIRAGIQNVFDQKPPTVATGVDQLGYSSFGDPRLQRFTLALRKHF